MSSSPLKSKPRNNESPLYPLIHSFDPYFNIKLDGDQNHAGLIARQIDSVYDDASSNAPSLGYSYATPSHLSTCFTEPLIENTLDTALLMNTCEVFPDFDPQLLLIQFRNENLIGIDIIREDEGIDKENDDANQVSYYNPDHNGESQTESESDNGETSSVLQSEEDKFQFEFEVEDAPPLLSGAPNMFTFIQDNNTGIPAINPSVTTLSMRNQSTANVIKKPLKRISTPNYGPNRPIGCNQKNCNKTFSTKNDYKKHLRTHSTLTFQCPYHYSMPKHKGKHIFNRMDVWKRHLRTFHFEFIPDVDSNQGLGNCRVCGEYFEYFNVFADDHIEICSRRLRYQLRS